MVVRHAAPPAALTRWGTAEPRATAPTRRPISTPMSPGAPPRTGAAAQVADIFIPTG